MPDAWEARREHLGAFIRERRKQANLSLRQLAELTSLSNPYLSQVERGLHQPSLKVLRSIADALQLSTDQLLSQAGWARGAENGEEAGTAAAPTVTTEDAIRADPRLTPDQRTALLGVLRSFVDS
jgi:transcriptional regulator with XRE-family HTH domain